MLRSYITRRALLKSLSATGAWLVAACSGPEQPDAAAPRRRVAPTAVEVGSAGDGPSGTSVGVTPAATDGSGVTSAVGTPFAHVTGLEAATPTSAPTLPPQVTVALDPSLRGPVKEIAAARRDRLARGLDGRATDGDADLVLTVADASAGQATDGPFVHIEYVAVVSRRLLVRDVPYERLLALWHGDIQDWSVLGSPDPYPVTRVTLAGSSGPFDAASATDYAENLDDLAARFVSDRGALAIIPLAYLDFRFRALTLDGFNPLRPGDAVNPLRLTLSVRARAGLTPGDIQRIQAALADDAGPAPTSMTWTGDIIFGRTVHVKMVEYGDWAAPFRSIWPELVWADTTIGNLECALSDSFETPTDPTTFDFKTSTAAVAGLELAQIDVLSRANNHSFNFGELGMQDTTDVLEQAGILHFGMGHNLDEARRAVVIERNGVTYALLGYNGISDDWDGATGDSAGTMPMEDEYVIEDIQREVANGHVVIPFFHWGVEYVSDPTEEQRHFAHIAIDAGASLVMGSHPHWVQAVESYQGKAIVYSLGNFVFDQSWSIETQQGMLAHVWMQADRALKIDLVPVWIEDQHKPRLMEGWEAAPVLDRVWAASDLIIAGG